MKHLWKFLGSLYLAIFLIACAAIVVMAGTFIESQTGSHLAAEKVTYNHPFFMVLLAGFFVNILVSALHRWPFKKKHFPFLLTHLGLLLLISGVFLKNLFGIQGQMLLWEGSGSSRLFIPHSFAIQVKKKHEDLQGQIPLSSFDPRLHFCKELPEISCRLVGYCHDVKSQLLCWSDDRQLTLFGIPPLTFLKWEPQEPLPKGIFSRPCPFYPDSHIYALETDKPEALIQALFLEETALLLFHSSTGEKRVIPIREALESGISYKEASWQIKLNTSFTPYSLIIENEQGGVCYPLSGSHALLIDDSSSFFPFEIDIKRPSGTLAFCKGEKELTLIGIDPYGRLYQATLPLEKPDSYIAYDSGFQGYGTSVCLPFPNFPCGRKEKEEAYKQHFIKEFEKAIFENQPMDPELYSFVKTCQKNGLNPSITLQKLLEEWKAQGRALYLGAIVSSPKEDFTPLLSYWKQKEPLKKDHFLKELNLEAPLRIVLKEKAEENTLENQTPGIAVLFEKGEKRELLHLAYDPYGMEIKWPLFNDYLVSFTALQRMIPHHLRLREARQICYPDSSTPERFESDLLIKNFSNEESFITLSMNEVHETTDDYRFYLSGITSSKNGDINHIRLAVNKDPFKYYLTYPGGLFVSIGAFMLLFRRQKKDPQ